MKDSFDYFFGFHMGKFKIKDDLQKRHDYGKSCSPEDFFLTIVILMNKTGEIPLSFLHFIQFIRSLQRINAVIFLPEKGFQGNFDDLIYLPVRAEVYFSLYETCDRKDRLCKKGQVIAGQGSQKNNVEGA